MLFSRYIGIASYLRTKIIASHKTKILHILNIYFKRVLKLPVNHSVNPSIYTFSQRLNMTEYAALSLMERKTKQNKTLLSQVPNKVVSLYFMG